MTTPRRFPPPWQVEQIPGGFKVLDASGQALVYVGACKTSEQADFAAAHPPCPQHCNTATLLLVTSLGDGDPPIGYCWVP